MSTPGANLSGGAGGQFSQAFFNTLLTGAQFIDQTQRQREELDLNKRLADAKLKLMDVQIEDATRKAQGIAGLRERLTSTFDPFGAETPAAPLGRDEALRYAAKIDPELALKTALDPKQDLRSLVTGFFKGEGTLPAGGAPSQPSRGGVEQMAGPAAEGGSAPPPTTPPAATGGLGPQAKLDRTLTIDSDGKLSLKLGDRNVQYKIEHQTMVDPSSGKATVYRIITDPEDPRRSQILPMGRAVPPAELQILDLAATSYGLRPGTALHEAAVADLAAVAGLPAEIKKQALIAIENKYRTFAADPRLNPPLNPPQALPSTVTGVGLVGGATAAANQQEIDQAAAKAKATKQAELSVPEKASGAERDKLASQLSASDLYGQIKGLYKPDYVGPLRGGFGATAYERLGSMSQQEQQFRTAVTTANNQMIKDITGAQMSESEAARLLRQMPDPTLPANQFEARLRQTQINQKILAIRRRQVLEATGVDVSQVPKVTLTTEERRDVAAPIAQDYLMGQINRAEAVSQLKGLAQYGDAGANAFLTAIEGQRKR